MNMNATKQATVRVGPGLLGICFLITVILAVVKLAGWAAIPWIVVWLPLIAWAGLVVAILSIWLLAILIVIIVAVIKK